MTDLKALRREMAESLATISTIYSGPVVDNVLQLRIEKAMYEYAQAVLSEPSEAMIDVAVSFALNVKINGEYRWSQYTREMWDRMAAQRAKELK